MHFARSNVTLDMQREQLPRSGAAHEYVLITADDWLLMSNLMTEAQRMQLQNAEVEYVPFTIMDSWLDED